MKFPPFTLKQTIFLFWLTGFVFPVSLWAGQNSSDGQFSEVLASIWKLPKLYADKDNPYIQSFSLVGRYHGQYWSVDSEDNRNDDWENRRMYLGFNTKLFQQFTLEVQVNINDDFDPLYKSLYDAFIKWENSTDDFEINVGRLDYVYTGMERSTSSKKIKTMERALLVNQVMPGEVIGTYVKGKSGSLSYQTGLFSGSIEDEFTSFKGGFAALLGFGYTMTFFYDKGILHLDYLYNNCKEDNNAFKSYEHIVSLWHQGQRGALGIDVDFTMATGIDDSSDVFGLTLLPTYDLAHSMLLSGDKLQLALRYHYASSSDEHGLEFNKRYEQNVAFGKGDAYNSYYLGLNYFIYQHKLKLMAGVEYFDMAGVADDDSNLMDTNKTVDGWSFISSVRLYF